MSIVSIRLAFFFLVLPSAASAAATVRFAADVCSPLVDPCVVDREYDVAAGSRLDFGLRTLRVEGGGLLDFGAGDAEVACGSLEASGGGPRIRVRGPAATGGSAGGLVEFTVQGRCSGAPTLPCLFDHECASAAAGACSGGVATILGGVVGDADSPGRFVLRAAGDVAIGGGISLSSTRASSDGGVVEVESTTGSVRVTSTLDASGGTTSAGGSVELLAAVDVILDARIDATGGDFDGGAVTIDAGRDAMLHDDVRVDATGGAGFGGEVDGTAGRDLVVAGGSALNLLVIGADGHQSAEGSGGDGGTVNLEAGGDLLLTRHARILASGAPPDGFGDTVSLTSGGALTFDGGLVARGRGTFGGGALVDLASGGAMRVGDTASFDLRGPAAGGDLVLESEGHLDAAGQVEVSGGSSGVGGRVVAVAGGDADVSGRWTTAGAHSVFSVGELSVEGCRVRVSGELLNAADSGFNRLVAREILEAAPGSRLSATGVSGVNLVRYRDVANPPQLSGGMLPVPSAVVDASLEPCPGCGSADGDAADGCDDGNACTQDTCDEEGWCAHRAEIGVCMDDGDPCTADFCDASGRCTHEGWAAPCDDGDFCTTDERCVDGACPPASPPLLVAVAIRSRPDRDGNAVTGWKAELPLSLLPAAPETGSLRVVVADASSRLLLDATLAPGSLGGGDGAWRFRSASTAPGTGIGSAAIVSAAIVADPRSGLVRVKLRLVGAGTFEAATGDRITTALLFGEEPGTAPCAGSPLFACERVRKGLRCRSPAP